MGPRLGLILDSCILIDMLRRAEPARIYLSSITGASVSIVTHIEVLAGAPDPEAELIASRLLGQFQLCGLTLDVARRAAVIRRASRLKLPDAVIRATAELNDLRIVTRNVRDFPADDPRVLIPYTL